MKKRSRIQDRERRFYFTLYLAFLYALRISDLNIKNIIDYNITKKVITFKTKFSRVNIYKLDPTLILMLKKYRLSDLLIPVYLFRKEVKKRFSINPHDIRRSRATCLYNKTKDITQVQKLLGHSNINSSWIYVKRFSAQEPIYVSI